MYKILQGDVLERLAERRIRDQAPLFHNYFQGSVA